MTISVQPKRLGFVYCAVCNGCRVSHWLGCGLFLVVGHLSLEGVASLADSCEVIGDFCIKNK